MEGQGEMSLAAPRFNCMCSCVRISHRLRDRCMADVDHTVHSGADWWLEGL